MALVAENRLSKPDKYWNRIVTALRDLLRKISFKLELGTADLRKYVYDIGDEFAKGRRATPRQTDTTSPSNERFLFQELSFQSVLPASVLTQGTLASSSCYIFSP